MLHEGLTDSCRTISYKTGGILRAPERPVGIGFGGQNQTVGKRRAPGQPIGRTASMPGVLRNVATQYDDVASELYLKW